MLLSHVGYKYWDTLKRNLDIFKGSIGIEGCPFKDGLNQLWRNQILALALQETGIYSMVTFRYAIMQKAQC